MIKKIFATTFIQWHFLIKGLLNEINGRDENCYLQFPSQKQQQQEEYSKKDNEI